MDRRSFLARTGAVFLAAPLAAEAQVPAGKVWRIGMLDTTSAAVNVANLTAFRQGMKEFGYVERQNFVIEYRSADGRSERFPDLANELVRSKVDLIVTRGTPAVKAAANASRTLPIVMAASGDPLGAGVIAGLAHPGENVTGLSALTAEVSGKRLQLLKDAIPRLRRFAVVFDMGNSAVATQWPEIEAAARSMRLQPQLLDVRRSEDLERAFDTAMKQRAEAVMVGLGTVAQSNVGSVVALSTKHRLPSIYNSREFVDAGGLMAYGVSYPDLYRRAAKYVDKILKGIKPGDLPIEQPTKFELVINLKTAKALGLTIPPSLLGRADEVIQ
jgi:putative tryptophan/tyrosine transport system substrate-binding protein